MHEWSHFIHCARGKLWMQWNVRCDDGKSLLIASIFLVKKGARKLLAQSEIGRGGSRDSRRDVK